MPERIALVNAGIFDAHQGVIQHHQAVIIDGERIAEVVPLDTLLPNLPRIDLAGRTILPGFVDVHVHSEDWHAPLFLASGVIAVRDVGCELETVLRRRAEWNAPDADAPRLRCTGPLLDGPGNQWLATMRMIATPDEARAAVDWLVERGVDQIKPYAYLTWDCFEAIIQRARQHGKRTVAHLGKHCDARRAVEAGLNEIEHLTGISEAMWHERNQADPKWSWMKLWASIDTERMERMIRLLTEQGTWLAITRLIWQRLATLWDRRHMEHEQIAYVPEPLLKFWHEGFQHNMTPALRRERSQHLAGLSIFTTELARANARLIVGTDTPYPYLLPGFSFIDEMFSLLECGLTESQVLTAATLEGARALEMDTMIGSIEPGKYADMVVVDGDPLVDFRAVKRIVQVIRGGRMLSREQLLSVARSNAQSLKKPTPPRFNDLY